MLWKQIYSTTSSRPGQRCMPAAELKNNYLHILPWWFEFIATRHYKGILPLSHFFCDFRAGSVHLPAYIVYSHTARLLSSCLPRQTCHKTSTVLNLNTVLMSTNGLNELLILFGEQDGFATVNWNISFNKENSNCVPIISLITEHSLQLSKL